MKVLWFTNTPSLYNQNTHHYYGGGWIDSLEKLLRQQDNIELAVSFLHAHDNGRIVRKNNIYYPIKKISGKRKPVKAVINNYMGKIENKKAYLSKLLWAIQDFNPDIIHIFGTEGVFGIIQNKTDIPVVIHLQGLINPCYNTYFPPGFGTYNFIINKNYFFKNLLGFSPVFGYKRFRNQAKRELEYFKNAKYLMGRTQWDREISSILAPKAQYFHVDEVLRPLFYLQKKEEFNNGNNLKIISTISPTIYKGIDVVLKTAKLIKEHTNLSFEWKVAGLNASDTILKQFEKTLKINHTNYNIKLLGKLSPINLVEELKQSDVFIHPSYIDNSPNSVCEAQILGLPVIACNVGGVSTIIKDKETGLLVPANGIYEFTGLLMEFVNNRDKFNTIGRRAREDAMKRHDKKKIITDLIDVYNTIMH